MQTLSLIQCSQQRSIVDLISAEKGLTVDVAIRSTHISALARQVGERDLLKAVTGAIIMAGEYFNVKGGINESQAVQTAALFIEQFPMETFEDLLLCLKNAKLGKYGVVYNRIDGQTIFEWFRKYLDEKYERFEQIKKAEALAMQEESEAAYIDLAALALKNRPAEKKVTANDSLEKHLKQFRDLLPTLTQEELVEFRIYYDKENRKSFALPFTGHIELIDETLKAFKE